MHFKEIVARRYTADILQIKSAIWSWTKKWNGLFNSECTANSN